MKTILNVRVHSLIRWSWIGMIVILGQSGLFSQQVMAQDPTPLPTATSAPTWTPVPGATPSPTAGVPVGPTPGGPSPTPSGRLVNFRVDHDEIEEGECVLFSWVVRGDIAWVEFDQMGDGKDPVLVEDQGERSECPDEDTEYELIATWLDNSQTKQNIDIQVNPPGTGGSGGTGGTATVPTPGSFVPVTPISFSQIQQVTPIAGGSSPGGVLGTITELPETGMLSVSLDPAAPESVEPAPVAKSAAPSSGWKLWLYLMGGLVIIVGRIVAGICLPPRLWHRSTKRKVAG